MLAAVRRVVLANLWAIALAAIPASSVARVTSADEVCPPNVDPCVINESVQIADNADLDFGPRTVIIERGGRLEIGINSVVLRCGELRAQAPRSTVIDLNGESGFGGSGGGSLEVFATRRCSASPMRACVSEENCQLGACSQRLCSGDTSRRCGFDGNCQLGPCGLHTCSLDRDRICTSSGDCDFGECDLLTRSCTNNSSVNCLNNRHCQFGTCETTIDRCTGDLEVICADDGDCDAGTCSALGCNGDPEVLCDDADDCDLGACSVGSGVVDIDGRIRGDAVEPGLLEIAAAGDVVLRERVNLSARNREFDGGFLELRSGLGSVAVFGPITATGGVLAQGGEVCFEAADDVVIAGEIDIDGGDFDGGFLEVVAGRDVVIEEGARLRSLGARPDGFGGEMGFDAVRDVVISGRIDAAARGVDSGGGVIRIDAAGAVSVTRSGRVAVDGIDGVGEIFVEAAGPISIVGRIAAGRGRRPNTGDVSSGWGVFMASDDNVIVDGRVELRGDSRSGADGLEIEGCDMVVGPGAKIRTRGENASNRFVAGGAVTVAAGAKVDADRRTGENIIRHRDALDPPVIDGRVRPAPTVFVDSFIPACP